MGGKNGSLDKPPFDKNGPKATPPPPPKPVARTSYRSTCYAQPRQRARHEALAPLRDGLVQQYRVEFRARPAGPNFILGEVNVAHKLNFWDAASFVGNISDPCSTPQDEEAPYCLLHWRHGSPPCQQVRREPSMSIVVPCPR